MLGAKGIGLARPLGLPTGCHLAVELMQGLRAQSLAGSPRQVQRADVASGHAQRRSSSIICAVRRSRMSLFGARRIGLDRLPWAFEHKQRFDGIALLVGAGQQGIVAAACERSARQAHWTSWTWTGRSARLRPFRHASHF